VRHIELSHAINDGMPVFPGLEPPRIRAFLDHERSRPRYQGEAELHISKFERAVGSTNGSLDRDAVRVQSLPERSRLHAGACPLDGSGNVVPDDLVGQAERATDNLLVALAEAGATADSLLKTTIYVVASDRSDLVRVWDVVSERLGRAPSTLLGVSFLGYPEQLVEIEAVAAAHT
jgi:enamine deaminase RidA (YjgF/YER057c/UK114 family)